MRNLIKNIRAGTSLVTLGPLQPNMFVVSFRQLLLLLLIDYFLWIVFFSIDESLACSPCVLVIPIVVFVNVCITEAFGFGVSGSGHHRLSNYVALMAAMPAIIAIFAIVSFSGITEERGWGYFSRLFDWVTSPILIFWPLGVLFQLSRVSLAAFPVRTQNVAFLFTAFLCFASATEINHYGSPWSIFERSSGAFLQLQDSDFDEEDEEEYGLDETLLYGQEKLLGNALATVAQGRVGKIEVYPIVFSSYGYQKVFTKEAIFVREVLGEHFKVKNQVVTLINSTSTSTEAPLATLTSLRRVINGVSEKMNRNEDILILYLTSHGSFDGEFSVELDGFELEPITPLLLKELISFAGIRFRVIIVSSCYFGKFIDGLADKNTLVMTASAADRSSYGCSDETELTYFAEALFKDQLARGVPLREAFDMAQIAIAQRELEEGRKESRPQIEGGEQVLKRLKRFYRASSTDKVKQ